MAEAAVSTNKKAFGKPDQYIIGIFVTLCVVSIVETYSASSREITNDGGVLAPMLKQLALMALSIGAMFGLSRANYVKFPGLSIFFCIVTVGFALLTPIIGVEINGAKRSIQLPGFTVQPAEMAKLAVVFALSLVLAMYVDKRTRMVTNKGLVLELLIIAGFGALLIKQGLTNTILFSGISLCLVFVGGVSWRKYLVFFAGVLVIVLAFLVIQGFIDDHSLDDPNQTEQVASENNTATDRLGRLETWKKRIKRYADKYKNPLYNKPLVIGENDQEMFSCMAQANGGITGVMPGNSRECSRLPLAFSDYVFSIVVEDTGFIGGSLLIILYFSLLIRASHIAARCTRKYPAFLIMGMAVFIVLQAFFHVAINVGLFPVSGQSLPMISKGGTSLLMTGIAFGVMVSISRTATKQGDSRALDKQEKDALPEALRTDNQVVK